MVMNEKSSIDTAYDELIQDLFKVLFDGLADAHDDPAEIKKAEARFQAGVVLASKARERAYALLA
jgi:hypothetical protein